MIKKDKVKGVEEYSLLTPKEINGTKYDKIILDFENLTGEDMNAIESQMTLDGQQVVNVAELSKVYLMYVSARAAKININDFKKFSFKDITGITALTQVFLMG